MPWKCFMCIKSNTEDITKLDYRHCSLTDVPPEVFAFERTLEELYLDANTIKDLPRPLFHCHGLRYLGFSDNEIQNIPPAISSLVNLEFFDISKNGISSIPDNIKGCKLLRVVDASVNPLEKLPEGFMQLLALEELYLNDTYLEFLPANFGRLLKLRILELRENHLNTLPKSIARLVNLQRLDIGQNEFSDLPEVVGQLPNITELWCDFNRIRSIPQFIGNLKKLIHLDASNNNINWIASEIESCVKLSDLTLSGNEIQEVPESIGNLKNLMTLKLDDNQLATLPDSIGKLSNLEELILSQNDFETLPPSVGLLRKLHILNVDENMLEDLPPEIGSCCNLRILSVAGNHLIQIPGEIGHLSNLKVANLCGNRINNLPVSLLGLSSLGALWLSDNQAQPLVPLQSDVDPLTGQHVLTCFMLPQTSTLPSTTPASVTTPGYPQSTAGDADSDSRSEEEKIRRRHIRFAADSESEAGGRLLRAPTPYPKELRALARHARSLQRVSHAANGPVSNTSPLSQTSFSSQPSQEGENATPVVAEWIPSGMQENKIKEAKVTKSHTAPIAMTEGTKNQGNLEASDKKQSIIEETAVMKPQVAEKIDINLKPEVKRTELEQKGANSNEDSELAERNINQNKIADESDKACRATAEHVHDSKISWRHQEKTSSKVTDISVQANDIMDNHEISANASPSVPSQPPPYHIAAAYSKKAAFFNCDVQSRNSISSLPPFSFSGGRHTPLSEIKGLVRPSSAALAKYEPSSMESHSYNENSWIKPQNPEPQDKITTDSELLEVNRATESSTNESVSTNKESENNKMSDTEPEMQMEIMMDSHSPEIDVNESDMNTYQNIASVTSIKNSSPVESPDVLANKPMDDLDAAASVTESPRILGDESTNNLNTFQYDHVNSSRNRFSGDDAPQFPCEIPSNSIPCTSPDVSTAANSQIETVLTIKPCDLNSEKNRTTPVSENESQKSTPSRIPISRIKTIPKSAQEEIREISLGKPPNFTQDKPSAGIHLIAPTPQRVNTIINHSSSLEGVKDNAAMNNSSNTSNKSENVSVNTSRIPSLSGTPSPKPSPNWQQNDSPAYYSSKVPQQGFLLSKRSSASSPSYGINRQVIVSSPVHHSIDGSSVKPASSVAHQSKIPQFAGQNNSSILGSSGKFTPSKGTEYLDKSSKSPTGSSKIPTLSPTRGDIPPTVDHTLKSRIPISPHSKPMKNWMFGLHKNAMVFPVTIHKNPGLGFSIAGGHLPSTSQDKQDSGIYITKIHPNSPASANLLPGDKILEVDGVDFTKLEHDQAVSVLTQTGNIVQMMISRQQ